MAVVLPGRSPFIKPPPGAKLIAGHSLCNGLYSAMLMNDIRGADATGRVNLSTLSGFPRLVHGAFGSQATFYDGSSFSRGTITPFLPSTNFPITLAAWITPTSNPGAVTTAVSLGSTNGTATNQKAIGTSAGFNGSLIQSATAVAPAAVLVTMRPTLIVCRIELYGASAAATVWINGQVVRTAGISLTTIAGGFLTIGGGSAGATLFTGVVDAAFLWNRFLTDAEAALLYSQPFSFLRHPSTVRYFFPASTVATSYTLSGPSSGTVNVASTNFTVTPVGGTSTATVTPASTGAGTFTPSTVTFSGSGAKTFTYTPTSTVSSPHTISVTNNGGLTNPGSLSYTVNPAFNPGCIDATSGFVGQGIF